MLTRCVRAHRLRYVAGLLVLLVATLSPLQAGATGSANYSITVQTLNNGGGTTSSANFRTDSSVGEGLAAGAASSANFRDNPGFQPSAHSAVPTYSVTYDGNSNTSGSVPVDGNT